MRSPTPALSRNEPGPDTDPHVLGIDGCPHGWVVARWNPDEASGEIVLAATFTDVLRRREATICLDMIVGLDTVWTTGGRAVERALRTALRGKGGSIFPAPPRAVLEAATHAEATQLALAHSDPPKGLSAQTRGIVPKIREVDAVVSPALESRVYEGHPEATFATLLGSPLAASKKSAKGRAARRALLLAVRFPPTMLDARPRRPDGRLAASMDDVLDACAMAWSAARIRAGRAIVWPDRPARDARGLRQAVYA